MAEDMSKQMVLGNRVREVRTRIGMRQSDLAEAIGVTRQTIIAIEQGRLNTSVTLALKIARALREPIDYVFYLERAARAMHRGETAEDAGAAVSAAKRRSVRRPTPVVVVPPVAETAPAPPQEAPGAGAKPGRPKAAAKERPKREDDSDIPQSVFDFR